MNGKNYMKMRKFLTFVKRNLKIKVLQKTNIVKLGTIFII